MENKKELKLIADNKCSIKDWAEYNGLEYEDVLKIFKRRKIALKRFGRTIFLEKSELDSLLILVMHEYEQKRLMKIDRIKNAASQKKAKVDTMNIISNSGIDLDTIKQVAILCIKDPEVNKLLTSKNIILPQTSK